MTMMVDKYSPWLRLAPPAGSFEHHWRHKIHQNTAKSLFIYSTAAQHHRPLADTHCCIAPTHGGMARLSLPG